MISLFLFVLSWAVYAGVFFAASQILPAFHSDYREATLSVGFLIGFFNVMFVRVARWLRFSLNLIFLAVLTFLMDWGLIKGTGGGNYEGNYYVTGNYAPVVVALVLALTLVVLESIKRKLMIER